KEFIEESKERFSKIICRILDIDEYFTQNNNFRIHKPMVQFSGKEANSILYLFKKNIDAITTEDDVFYSQVAYADPLKYKNNHLITFFLNCAIEEEKQIYGEVKKNVIRALNESKECFKDLYELVHQYKQAGDSKSGENTLLKQFEELERKGVVSESKRYSEFLDILASDILTISSIRAQRMKELEINKSTFENTLKREEYLKKMRSNLEEHFYSFTEEIIVKNKGRDDSSKYGTYRYDLNSLKKQNVVKQMNDFADEDLQFVLSCDNPNVFKFELFVSNVKLAGTELRLDELLRMRYKGEDTFVVKKLIVVYVEGMIDLINEKYFKE
ncbi:Ras GTPase-activating-like protein IQG1, partial [Dictyocoela roeselum]